MALQPTNKPVPLFGGLDLKNDPKYVALERNLTAQNVRYPSVSRAEKRYGQTVLSNTVPLSNTLITEGRALGSFNNELLAYDGTALYGYSDSSGSWQSRGNLTEAVVSVSNVSAGINSASNVSSASNGSVEVYAWEDTDGYVYYSARDTVSGSSYQQNTQLARGSRPQVVMTPLYAYIFALFGTRLTAYRLGLGNLGAGVINSTTVATDVSSGGYPAAVYCQDPNNPYIYVAYQDTSAGPYNLVFAGYTQAMVLVNRLPNLFCLADPYISITPNTQTFDSVAFTIVAVQSRTVADSNTVYSTYIYADVSTDFGGGGLPLPSIPLNVTGVLGTGVSINVQNNTAYISASWNASGVNVQPWTSVASDIDADEGMSWNPNYLLGLSLSSQLASRSDGVYWVGISAAENLLSAESQQITYYLCGVTRTAENPTILSRYLGSQADRGTGNPASISSLSTGDIFLGQAYRAVLRADATGTVFTSSYITGTTFSFPTTSGLQVVPFNGAALLTCGLTYNYDGISLVENGFWEFPDGINSYTGSPGTNYIYQYFVTYEWTDALGNVTISAPSYALTMACATPIDVTNTCILAVPYTVLTRRDNVKICVYRTVANSSSPAYKIGTVANVKTGAGAINFNDSTTDLVAQGGQRLYAPADFSGELENEPAPPFKYMFATKTRVFGIPQDNPYQIWYSKPLAFGRPAEFTPAQAIPIESAGGGVTGLSALDTQAVVFKAHRIYYLPGDGPNAAGRPYNAFPSSLQLIASTTGCTSNQSILSTAEGLYFQSPTGLTQLSRGLQVNPAFGIPVQPLVQALTLTGAQAIPAQNQLRWTSAEGTAVVYDYVTQRWTTYTNYDAVGYQPFGTTYARLRTDGRVWYEDTTTYLDDGIGVQMKVETSWLKPAELAQGFAAVWYAIILGEYKSAHNLVIEVAFDYLDQPADTVIFDATTNGNFGFYGSGSPYGSDPYYGSSSSTPIYSTAYQPRYALKRQVCEAVKFKIYDTGITGASCALNEIALQLGVIGGLKRVPRSQQV